MKTLADFKREINVGYIIECVNVQEPTNKYTNTLVSVGPTERMQGKRTVTYKDTTGFYLNQTLENGKRGSFCGFPKASDLLYTGDRFVITEKYNNGKVWQVRHYKIYK